MMEAHFLAVDWRAKALLRNFTADVKSFSSAADPSETGKSSGNGLELQRMKRQREY
jgi:hypothetical protein